MTTDPAVLETAPDAPTAVLRVHPAPLRTQQGFGPLVGSSVAMQRVYDLMTRVARTDATILITGETGTGKGLVAHTVHGLSRRSREPFLHINCGAVSSTLIESELFGHERGSFTGADRLHRGYFERANGGTLFLDEVTEMHAELQVKLLRVLEAGTLTRVGGHEPIRIDVRIIAATNRAPEQAVADGALRADLLYRLNVFPIPMPPLREHLEDVAELARHALRHLNRQDGTDKRFTLAGVQHLGRLEWPGNVRELNNAVARAFILSESEIGVRCLPQHAYVAAAPAAASQPLVLEVGISLADAQERLIRATLDHCGGDKKAAATLLGMGLKTLYNRLNEYRAHA